MRAAKVALAALWSTFPLWCADNPKTAAPSYTASSIVHAASFEPGVLVPNGLATIYGTELAFTTRQLLPSDMRGAELPVTLPGSGVSVIVNGLWAHVIYVSPGQINFLVPANLVAGNATVTVVRNGVAGSPANVLIAAARPGFFLLEAGVAVATSPEGKVVTKSDPARAGSVVVLYATGLGQTVPPALYGRIAESGAQVEKAAEARLVIDGRTAGDAILYAGVSPGFAGLYQVNVRLPDWVGADPEVRLMMGDALSPAGIRLPVGTAAATGTTPGASGQ